ncbi:MAG TPA: Fic family protein [Patescibacteria group bacterium]|nr:Fic family protein [Patescibacteria group bacterium]
MNPNKPYNGLPQLPPRVDLKDQELLLATLEASDAISQLKTMLTMSSRTISNTLDLLSPLFVPEAVSSSGVENIVTTNDSVYYAKIREERELNPAEKEALNYTKALMEGANKLSSKGFLNTNDYISLQRLIEPSNAGVRTLPGTQLSNPITHVVYYTPPDGEERIRSFLQNFEKYFNDAAPIHEVFARMAVLHYQFEAIHPFRDGNGRTGRMLMPLYLMKQGKLPVPVLFISHYILEHRDAYYRKLREVTMEGKWKEWILYIMLATAEQAKYTCGVLEKIKTEIDSAKKTLKDKVQYLYSSELVDYLFSNAYFTQKNFEEVIGVSPMTARKRLADLEKVKIVYKHRQTGRNRFIYITPRYIDILKHA